MTFNLSLWGSFSIRDLLNFIAVEKFEMILEWLIDLKRNFKFITVTM